MTAAVWLLQSRPETVWSRRARAPRSFAGSADPIASIVATLMKPLSGAPEGHG